MPELHQQQKLDWKLQPEFQRQKRTSYFDA
jgi:hypothetical protein